MPTKNPSKEQQARWNRAWYQKNKAKRREINDRQRQELREYIDSVKRQHACKCGEDHIACLLFHHRNPEEKLFNISDVPNTVMSKKKLDAEMVKCDIICANCHLKFHWGERQGR